MHVDEGLVYEASFPYAFLKVAIATEKLLILLVQMVGQKETRKTSIRRSENRKY